MKKKWIVEYIIEGTASKVVEAETKEEAVEKGWDFYHEAGGDALENLEWGVDEVNVSEDD
jgi:hypothetical protein